jgi:hypothetical protein
VPEFSYVGELGVFYSVQFRKIVNRQRTIAMNQIATEDANVVNSPTHRSFGTWHSEVSVNAYDQSHMNLGCRGRSQSPQNINRVTSSGVKQVCQRCVSHCDAVVAICKQMVTGISCVRRIWNDAYINRGNPITVHETFESIIHGSKNVRSSPLSFSSPSTHSDRGRSTVPAARTISSAAFPG